MDLFSKEPAVTKALAVALIRQAMELLDAVDEVQAASHLRQAVDTVLRVPRAAPIPGAA